MPFSFRRTRFLLSLALLPALAGPALAQQEHGRPTQDPFQRPTPPEARPVFIGSYKSHQYQNGILTLVSTEGGTLRVRPWAAGVLRIEYFPAGTPVRDIPSISVVQPADAWAPPGLHREGPEAGSPKAIHASWRQRQAAGDITETATTLRWPVSSAGTIVVQKKPLRVSYQQHDETLVQDAGGVFQRLTTETSGPGGTGVSLRLQPNEHLYGTGSRALPLDRRGRRLTLYNEAHYGYQSGEPTLNVSLPTVLSSRGYMLLFDHHAAATLDLGATDPNTLIYSGEDLLNLGYFIITGRSNAEILARYTRLTGRQPLPPRWALGLIQSRFGYRSDTEMLQVAGRMHRAGFPLDALVLDLYWFGGTTRQGDLGWDYANFRQPQRMIRRLDSVGVKTILISEPYVMRTSRHDGLVRAMGLVGMQANGKPYTVESFWAGPATILDMQRPETQDWLWSFYKQRKEEGVAGWWSDLGEPENHPLDMRHYKGSTRQVHNALGLTWAGIFQEKYTQEYRNERVFNLARSGWAGMQRNSVFPWSGDVSRSWSGLQAQVPIMLSMSLGGVGYMHSDAGGFAGNTVDAELYTRWLQMASFSPILRPHGAGTPPEPYWWPEPYRSIVREATHLRYRLLPYLYTLAWENTQTGAPLVRPMNFGLEAADIDLPNSQWGDIPVSVSGSTSHAEAAAVPIKPPLAPANEFAAEKHLQQQTWLTSRQQFDQLARDFPNLNDQYLLGPNLLVAPVLQPGQRRRNVVLPAGNWVDFYTNETLAGGRTVGRPAPLSRLPLLVRAGAFLPLTPYVSTTAAYSTDTLLVRYYADPAVASSHFTLYDDDGKSALVAKNGQYQLLTFSGSTSGSQTDIRVELKGRPFEGVPVWRRIELQLPRVATSPTAVLLDGETMPATEYRYDARSQTLYVPLLLESQHVRLTVKGLRLNTTPAADTALETLTLEAPGAPAFNSRTELRYTLHQAGAAGPLRIFDSRGQLIRTLPTATEAGPHTVVWNSDDGKNRPVPAGVYRAELAGQQQRLVVLR
ncbi:TIM-barrel domain-containing protein [Hymenobacter rigui]|nr:TIM-barrel domain-containing protein [Hymenobacter rigui]